VSDLGEWEREEPHPENVNVDWIELDLSSIYSDDDLFKPRTFAIRVESSSDDSEWLIHDPVKFLTQTLGAQFDLKITRVTTFIVNHHNTLSRIHLYATASTTDDGTVGLTLTKVPPGP